MTDAPAALRPLSDHALGELADIAKGPVPRFCVNPGCCDRLLRESLVQIVQAMTPAPRQPAQLQLHPNDYPLTVFRLRIMELRMGRLRHGHALQLVDALTGRAMQACIDVLRAWGLAA